VALRSVEEVEKSWQLDYHGLAIMVVLMPEPTFTTRLPWTFHHGSIDAYIDDDCGGTSILNTI
jgi:hypothetical protein